MPERTQVVERLRRKFAETGSPIEIPLLRGNSFKAELTAEGVLVSNLGNLPFLPWAVFESAVALMERNGGRSVRGDAMNELLGQTGLPLDSIEGMSQQRCTARNVETASFSGLPRSHASLSGRASVGQRRANSCFCRPHDFIPCGVNSCDPSLTPPGCC